MNKEEIKAHFKERSDDIAKTMSILSAIKDPISVLAQLICAISYDIALMFQYLLEKEGDNQ